jgi:hypothetical protein
MSVVIGFSRCLTLLFWEGMRGRRFCGVDGNVCYFGPVGDAQSLVGMRDLMRGSGYGWGVGGERSYRRTAIA